MYSPGMDDVSSKEMNVLHVDVIELTLGNRSLCKQKLYQDNVCLQTLVWERKVVPFQLIFRRTPCYNELLSTRYGESTDISMQDVFPKLR